MITNANITIVSRIFDEETREDKYIAKVIKGVSWYADFKASIGESGLKSGDIYKVRIPLDEDINIKVSKGDIVVRGDIEITESDTPKTIMKDREAFIVTSFSINARGSLKHIRFFGT